MEINYNSLSISKTRKKKINIKFYFSNIKLALFLLSFAYVYLKIDKKRILIHRISEISFVIRGYYYNHDLSNIQPSEIFVNGIPCDDFKLYHCNLDRELNKITLRFESENIKCYNIFRHIGEIIEIDISKFDTSNVSDLSGMFRNCINLKSINFGNINTSSIENMQYMFEECSSLTSIDLSNFDTSKVHYMDNMFGDCTNLTSLDLSNFFTYYLFSANRMFSGCSSLIYLNLFNFYWEREMSHIFDGLSSNAKLCIKDTKTLNRLLGKNITSECICSNFFDKIIDINKNICIDSCINANYNYEYNNTCYNKCPNNTFPLIYEKNEWNNITRQCFDHEPQGYYLDINEEIYKKCFDVCETCNGEGNEINHNCKKCKINYILINNVFNYSNCYNICKFYYYFDENNEYHCTENEICPEKYNKLIIDKNRCIDGCQKDNIYQFEYNNSCYKNCPSGTTLNETNNICHYYKISQNISNLNEVFNNFLINIKNNSDSILEIQDKLLENIQNILENGFDTSNIDNGTDSIMTYEEFTYTITTTSNQKNNKNNNVTTINLGNCEKKLKEKYNISKENNLYILKIDTTLDNIPKIEYEVYYPFSTNNLTKLDLSICKDIKIDISIPVKISPNEIDKYNMSSDIYNDICFTLTSENGTDKPLKERQNEFIKNNLSLCEENCDFGEYNNDTKKAVCSCFTKVKLPLISEIKVDKEKLFSNFKDIRNIANFKMLKCYNLLLDKSNIFKNAANYMLVILFIISLISLIVFICYNYIKIKKYIQEEFWKSNYLKNKNINQNVNQNIIKNKNKNRIIEINKNKKKDNKIVNNKKNSIKKDSNIRDKKTKIKITKLKDNKKSSLKNNQVSKKINLKSLKINNNNNKIINIKKKFQKQIIFKNNINSDEENSNYLMKSNKLKQENLKINKIPEKKNNYKQ